MGDQAQWPSIADIDCEEVQQDLAIDVSLEFWDPIALKFRWHDPLPACELAIRGVEIKVCISAAESAQK